MILVCSCLAYAQTAGTDAVDCAISGRDLGQSGGAVWKIGDTTLLVSVIWLAAAAGAYWARARAAFGLLGVIALLMTLIKADEIFDFGSPLSFDFYQSINNHCLNIDLERMKLAFWGFVGVVGCAGAVLLNWSDQDRDKSRDAGRD